MLFKLKPKGRYVLGFLAALLMVAVLACGTAAAPTPATVVKEVIKEVEVVKEVVKEVPKEVIVEKEVIKEIEVVKEVTKEIEVTPEPEPKETIIFADLDWDSAQQQNAVARYIVENGYGYPTDAIFGGSIPLWTGLLNNDIQVFMEIWLPNIQELWDKALADGAVIPVGKSLDDNWQSAFVVPTYVIEGDASRGIDPVAPDLKTPQDIEKYQDVFATAESQGKARLVTCLSSWGCSAVNEGSVESYGLADVIELQDPGSQTALFASLEGAFEKGEPWLGYLWGPTKTAAELDLTILQEEDCAGGAGPETGCAYPSALVRIAVHPTLISRAPEVVEFLRVWNYSADIQVSIDGYKAETDADFQEAAIWFLKNQDVWTQWVPDEVAEKVNTTLASEG